jgi:MerR family redox-sensitive transcriptional activator SoxR
MTIGEIGRQSGLAPSAIRFYERAGLLGAPLRKSGRRAYTPDVVHQLALIRFAKDVGFTLPQIRLLLHGFPQNTTASARWRTLARGKIKELDEAISKAQAMKNLLESMANKCECRTLEDCAKCLATY